MTNLLGFVAPIKERLASVQLDENAAEAPHIDGLGVGQLHHHLRRSIEAALDVRIGLLPSCKCGH